MAVVFCRRVHAPLIIGRGWYYRIVSQMMPTRKVIESIDDLLISLRERLYVAERGLATSIYLAYKLGRPLFLEGEAGVGKTEVAKMMADIFET